MRIGGRVDRVFGFSRSIVLGCVLITLLTWEVSGQVEEETFEKAFGLKETGFKENNESLLAPTNANHLSIELLEPILDVENLNVDENGNPRVEETTNEIPPNVEPSSKNDPKEDVKNPISLSSKIHGKLSGKYVRYGKCSDINGRDH